MFSSNTECFKLGCSPGHHSSSRVPAENRFRRVRGVGRMVLDQHRGRRSRAMDATDWQDMGTARLCDTACALHPHQETHPQSGKPPVSVFLRFHYRYVTL